MPLQEESPQLVCDVNPFGSSIQSLQRKYSQMLNCPPEFIKAVHQLLKIKCTKFQQKTYPQVNQNLIGEIHQNQRSQLLLESHDCYWELYQSQYWKQINKITKSLQNWQNINMHYKKCDKHYRKMRSALGVIWVCTRQKLWCALDQKGISTRQGKILIYT